MSTPSKSHRSATGPDPSDAGLQAGALIQEHVQAVLDEAKRSAEVLERSAQERGERAAVALEARAREWSKNATTKALDEAHTRAAAIVSEAEEQASELRKRAQDEAARTRARAVQEAERAASRARARLLKYVDTADGDLAALIAALRRDAGG